MRGLHEIVLGGRRWQREKAPLLAKTAGNGAPGELRIPQPASLNCSSGRAGKRARSTLAGHILAETIISLSKVAANSHREILFSFCDASAGAGDGSAGLRADGDAICDSRAGSCGAHPGGTFAHGGGASRVRPWPAGSDRAAILFSANSRGADHVAASAVGNESEAWLAGARGAEPGTVAGGDS